MCLFYKYSNVIFQIKDLDKSRIEIEMKHNFIKCLRKFIL